MEQDWAVLAQSIVHVRGPLTKGLTAGSFSDRLAPFTLTAWLFLLFWYLMFFAHEMYAAKIEPLLANGKSSSLLFQSSLLFYWFCGYVNEAMLLPVTLDFAASMGQSATMSGFFIGSSLIASILGVFMGKRVVNEEFWDQCLARALILWSNLLASLFMLLEAVVSNWAVHWSLPSKRAVFWVMMLLSQVAAFCLSLPQVPLLVMWGKFTPKSEMSFWMVLTQCARQGGVIAGPAVFALVSVIVSQGGRTQLAPCSLMAWAIFAQVIFGLFSIVLNSMVLPQLPPDLMTDPLGPIGVRPPLDPLSSPKKVPKPDGATTVDPERPPRSVEALERSQRREVVWGMIIYGFARYFVTTSIQMGTLMLLEVSYGLSAELSGAIFTVMCLSSFAVSGLASAVISRQVIDESALFLACNAVALLGVIFFFDFGTGAFGLLFATTVVYSCASLSNGIAEGWASRAAQEGTDFSNEAYRTLSMSLSYLASFMASVVARAFLDLGGRNLYAALQLVMVTLSTIIVYKVVSMTWDLSHEVTQNGKESGKEV